MITILPEIASPDNVHALRAEVEQLDEQTLAERTERLWGVVNSHREVRDRLERAFLKAQDDLSAKRLTDVLNDAGGNDIKAAEELAKEAREKLRQHDITYQRALIVLKACQERQQWLASHRTYLATSYAASPWKQEYQAKLEETRQGLARLLALYVRLNNIQHPSAVHLASFL